MSNDPFTNVETIYKNREVLTIGYQPESVVERETEINKLATALNSVKNGWSPDNIIVYGKPGVGKTVVTRHVLKHLNNHVNFTQVRVTCQTKSSYQTTINIVNELRENTDRDLLPQTGLPWAKVRNTLFEELNHRNEPTIIVLDEIDLLANDDKLLYELPRAEDNGKLNEDAAVGIIGISNDFAYRNELSPKVRDSLGEKEIQFQPYNATELQSILHQRAEKAIPSDVLDGSAIPLCASYATQENGSARQAIELLRETIDLVEERGLDEATDSEVREARERVKKSQIKDAVACLTDHGIYALAALGYAVEKSDSPVKTKEAFEKYRSLVQLNGSDPLVQDRFRDQLDDLTLGGFASQNYVNKGEKGGRYHLYDSEFTYDVIVEAVQENRDWALFDSDSAEQQARLNV